MIKNDNKPGITPKDVLKQIDYEHIKEHIPNPEYDFVDFFCGAGGMSYCNAFCQTKVGERATPYNAYAR